MKSELKLFLKWIQCTWSGHKIVKEVYSDFLEAEKGNREISLFSGKVRYCKCGKEWFSGSLIPWYEGSKKKFK